MTPTAIVVTALVIILGIYDLVVVLIGRGPRLSVSRFVASYARIPVVVFMVGYLCGHFFGYMTPTMSQEDQAALREVVRSLRYDDRTDGDLSFLADHIEKILEKQ